MKHKVAVSDDISQPPKKLKTSAEFSKQNENGDIFTSLEFKDLLKTPETQIQGLSKFCKACEKFDSKKPNALDIVKSYISTSPDCVEIFKCFGAQNSTGVFGPIFRSFVCILTRTAGDLKELYSKVGESICSSIIQSHLQRVYRALATQKSPRTVMSALRLLTIIVMQGKSSAREIANNVDFSMRCFKEILEFSKGKMGYEIRLYYIKFVLSFFISDDSQTMKRVLESQGLVSSVFRRLKSDPASVIQLVLVTLKERAIKNMLVPKTAKAHFFAEPKLLSQIASLFDWDGVSDITLDGSDDSVRDYVRQLVYEFLYHACCPFKYGINFKDKLIGTGEKSKNHVLLDFILHLVPLSSDSLVRDLIAEILKACPDLLPRYFSDFRLTLEPRDVDVWVRNFETIVAAYKIQPDVATALTVAASTPTTSNDEDKFPSECLVKMTLPGVFSPNFTIHSTVRHCLQCKSMEIRKKSLELIALFLKKIKATLDFTSIRSNWERSLYSYEEVELVVSEVKSELLKNFVSVPLMISLWNEISSKKLHELSSSFLEILSLLHLTFPHALIEAKFDFTKLLRGINISSQTGCEYETDSAVTTLKLLSQVANQCRWFKSGDDKKMPFQKLLQIIYDSRNFKDDIYEEAAVLVERILTSNDIIGADKSGEAQIWISNLVPKVKAHNDGAVLSFLTTTCGRVTRMPINYINILSSEENSDVNNRVPKVGEDFWSSLPEIEIQHMESKISNEKENNLKDQLVGESHLKDDMGGNVYPVSLLFVAVLDSLRDVSSFSVEERVIIDRYVTSVVSSLFHDLSSFEEAKFFASHLTSVMRSIPDCKTSFSNLDNFSQFTSLWTGDVITGFVSQDTENKDRLDGWLWNLITIKKTKGKCVDKKFPFVHSQSTAECQKDVYGIVPQCLLYFDSVMKFSDNHKVSLTQPVKELLHFIIFVLQSAPALKVKNYTVSTEDESVPLNPVTDSACAGGNILSDGQILLLWQRFLQTPSVQVLFFNDVYLQSSADVESLNKAFGAIGRANSNQSTTEVCTLAAAHAVKVVYLNHGCLVDDCAKVFISKTVQSILKLFEELANCRKPIQNTQFLLLTVFKTLQPLVPSEDIQIIFNDVSRLLPKVSMGEVALIFDDFLSYCAASVVNCNPTKISNSAITANFNFVQSSHLADCSRSMACVIDILGHFPDFAVVAPSSVIDFCLQSPNLVAISLAAKLMQCNPYLISHWCSMERNFLDLDLDGKIRIIPVVSQVLKILSVRSENESRNHSLKKIVKSFKEVFRCEDINVIFRVLEMDGGCEFLESCLKGSRKMDNVSHLSNLLEQFKGYNESNLEAVVVTCKILDKVARFFTDASNFKMIATVTLLKLITTTKEEKFGSVYCDLLPMLEENASADNDTFQEKVAPVWTKFLKHTMKYYVQNKSALQCLNAIIPVMYSSAPVSEDIPSTAVIRAMVISHSKFLPTIFQNTDTNNDGKDNLKDALTDLLFTLTTYCTHDELSDKDLGFLLGAYQSTLSHSDQNILKTIFVYEQKGLDLSGFKPFLWGAAALSSYRARKNLGDTLWKKPSPSEILSCIDKTIMDSTLLRFPLRRRMMHMDHNIKNEMYFENDLSATIVAGKNEIRDNPVAENVYDPCFLLPAFLELLSPQNLVDCKLFVQSGAFSFLMCCLSSHCHIVRSMSATCLSLYYDHAQTAWFAENNLTMYMIRCIRNSLEPIKGDVTMVIPKLSAVVANFFSNLVTLHSTPDDHMFAVLHRFLLVKPQFDLKNIPEFFVLFFSAEMECKVERTWIMNLISQSLRDMGDYHIIKRKNVFQLAMCLHDSPISDNYSRRQVFEILEQACSIRSAAIDLAKSNGLISWLIEATMQQPCKCRESDGTELVGIIGKRQENTNHIIRVTSTLWKTLNMTDFVAEEISEIDSGEKKQDKHAALAPFRVVKQLISLAVSLVGNLSVISDFDENKKEFLTEALGVLESCLSNLDERRKLAKIRRKESHDSTEDGAADLRDEHIETLLKVAHSASSEGMRCLVKILTFWEPRPREVAFKTCDLNLRETCIVWSFGPALEVWSKETIWIEKNLRRLLEWSQKLTSCMRGGLDVSIKHLLAKCYSIICCNIGGLGGKSFECLQLLNNILDPGSQSSRESEKLDLLNQMQEIRCQLLPDE